MPEFYTHTFFDENSQEYVPIRFEVNKEVLLLSLRKQFSNKKAFVAHRLEVDIKRTYKIKERLDFNTLLVETKRGKHIKKNNKFIVEKLGTTYKLNDISYKAWRFSLMLKFDSNYTLESINTLIGKNKVDQSEDIYLVQYASQKELDNALRLFDDIDGVHYEINLAKIESSNYNTNLEILDDAIEQRILDLPKNTLFNDIQQIHSNGKRGVSSIRIGVLDDGVYEHTFLKKAMSKIKGHDYISGSSVALFHIDDWHGTMCAGILGAQSIGEWGMHGVASGCSIIPFKIIKGKTTSQFALIKAITDAAYDDELSVDVLSCSIDVSCATSEFIRKRIVDVTTETDERRALPIVFAAGNISNYGSNILNFIPKIPSVITVSAVDENYEPLKNSKFGNEVFISAIGSNVITLDVPGDECYLCNSEMTYKDFLYFGKTSAAAPQVAGAIALIKSKSTNYLSINEIKKILLSCTEPKFENNLKQYGHGVLQLNLITNYLNI